MADLCLFPRRLTYQTNEGAVEVHNGRRKDGSDEKKHDPLISNNSLLKVPDRRDARTAKARERDFNQRGGGSDPFDY